uniref:pilus assembly PilX family protein n=1 Tax=uncultured Halomonas sp. TaxID=173971 RepID=UPI00262CED0E|nr:PilX N-terminal domain-containing pilus assembly protein [uncultured Halomonas sp.]
MTGHIMTGHRQEMLTKATGGLAIRKQRGAALIIVLLFLTVSLMIGLASMRSAQIDERLAGNYRAAAEAQMRAENAASALYGMLGEKEAWKDFGTDELSSGFGWKAFHGVAADTENDSHCHMLGDDSGGACHVAISGDHLGLQEGRYIIAMGAVEGGMAEGGPVFVRMAPPDAGEASDAERPGISGWH